MIPTLPDLTSPSDEGRFVRELAASIEESLYGGDPTWRIVTSDIQPGTSSNPSYNRFVVRSVAAVRRNPTRKAHFVVAWGRALDGAGSVKVLGWRYDPVSATYPNDPSGVDIDVVVQEPGS